jgi:hypothetical protein
MPSYRRGDSLLRPLWTRLPRWFAVELEDPALGPVQIGPSWVLEAEAIRELVQGRAPDLPPPASRRYEVAGDGPRQWPHLVLYRNRLGTWLVARTASRELAEHIADQLNRSLGDPEPEEA